MSMKATHLWGCPKGHKITYFSAADHMEPENHWVVEENWLKPSVKSEVPAVLGCRRVNQQS